MAALTNWQKSLRRSTGEINKPIIKKTHHVRSKRLPSIVEDENVFADENAVATKPGPRGDRQRRRLSTKGSVSEVDQAVEESANPRFRKTSSGKSPTKVDKSLSFLRPFPKRETFLLEDEVYKNLPSPIPLPPGVTNIDDDDDSTEQYALDIFRYIKDRNERFKPNFEKALAQDAKLENRREMLAEWLIAVVHSFNCSQETLYHTIDILDRCLVKARFKADNLQLLGLTAFLLATKLDEYYPADIGKLCHLTEDTATPQQVRQMELHILELLNLELYGVDPMTFVHRFLKAAFKSKNFGVYELSILFMDAMVQKLELWNESCSKKAAICVLASLLVFDKESKSLDEIWTPNLKYYAWDDAKSLLPTSIFMLNTLIRVLKDATSTREFSISIKYSSVSRHRGFLSTLSVSQVRRAIERAETF